MSQPLGNIRPETNASETNRQAFVIQQMLNRVQTATLVRVDAVTNAGEISPVGFVDVTPLVNQVNSDGIPTPHITVFNIPYFRLQGGANAIILDPQIGDIGVCVFASRDISKVKTTKSQANPGSARTFSYCDGTYLGGMLNGTPAQYVDFSTAGIRIHSPVKVLIDAPIVQIVAPAIELTASASVKIVSPVFTHNNVNVGSTHVHGGVEPGGGSTSGPS